MHGAYPVTITTSEIICLPICMADDKNTLTNSKSPTKGHGHKSADQEELFVIKEYGCLSWDAEVSVDG